MERASRHAKSTGILVMLTEKDELVSYLMHCYQFVQLPLDDWA